MNLVSIVLALAVANLVVFVVAVFVLFSNHSNSLGRFGLLMLLGLVLAIATVILVGYRVFSGQPISGEETFYIAESLFVASGFLYIFFFRVKHGSPGSPSGNPNTPTTDKIQHPTLPD